MATPEIWTGEIEYFERRQGLAVGSRVVLHGSNGQGTISSLLEDSAQVTWDSIPPTTTNPPPNTVDSSLAPNSSTHLLSDLILITPIKPHHSQLEFAKYGSHLILGAMFTLDPYPLTQTGPVQGYLDLSEYRATIRVKGKFDAENGNLDLEEVELVSGKTSGWHARFNSNHFQPGTRYSLKRQDLQMEGSFPGGTVIMGRDRLFSFAQELADESLCVSDGSTITVCQDDSESNSGVALGTVGFSRGVYYWEVKVDFAEEHGTVLIGVAERPIDGILPASTNLPHLQRWEKVPALWGFVNFRAAQSNQQGGKEHIYGDFFETDNVVGVLLDLEVGEISFFLDALKFGAHVVQSLGPAFSGPQLGSRHPTRWSGLRGDSVQYLYPAVGIKKCSENVVSLSDKFIAFPGSDPKQELENLTKVRKLLTVLQTRAQSLPTWFVDQAYAQYVRMMSNRYRSYPSRAGGRVIELDISAQAMELVCDGVCQPPLRVGEVVKVMHSQGRELSTPESAKVLGTRLGQVWYEGLTPTLNDGFPEGSTWAFFWNKDELATLIRDSEVETEPELPVTEVLTLSHDEFMAQVGSSWTREDDEALVHVTNFLLLQWGESDALNFDPKPVSLIQQTLDRFNLGSKPVNVALGRIALLRELNTMIKRALPICSEEGVGKLIHLHRDLLFTCTKRQFLDCVLKATTMGTVLPAEEYADPPSIRSVQLNRIKASPQYLIQIPSEIKRMRRSVFGQMYMESVKWPDHCFRRSFVGNAHGGQKRAFRVKLLGEGVEDYGGPYRQTFEVIVDELQNDRDLGNGKCLLPLLIPSPNRLHQTGEIGRDKFLFNCHAQSPSLLRRFEFLGKLVGTAIRQGIHMGFDFPRLFWKKLCGLKVQFTDLEEVDFAFCQDVKRLQTNQEWSEFEPRKFSILLSDGFTLVEDPLHEFVDRDNVDQFVEFAVKTRLEEFDIQFNAFTKGLAEVIPLEHLKMFTPLELQSLVCGQRGLDVPLLKSISEFEEVSETDNHVVWFFEVLEEMTISQREQFLIFVWARSRMPRRADITTKFRIQAPVGVMAERPDEYLPTAQTCFFSIKLPKYTRKDILKVKMMMAIECTLMDADVRLRNADGWGDI